MSVRLTPHLAPASALALAALAAQPASAQSTDPAGAEVLFQEARSLMQAGNLDAACPKFAESQRLDPATGTLIAVAVCHERQGLLASAWAELTEAAGRARNEGREDRVAVATERAAALRPRLSTLRIEAPASLLALERLVITRGDVRLSHALVNRDMPVDGGDHEVVVSAPGHEPVVLRVRVAVERDRAVLRVPDLSPKVAPTALVAAPAATAAGVPRPIEPTAAPGPGSEPPAGLASASTGVPPRDDGESWWSRHALAASLGATGAASLLAGGYFLGGALRRKSKSEDYCPGGSDCTNAYAVGLSREATTWGNAATVLGIAGAVLGVSGLTLYLTDDGNAGGAEVSLAVAPAGARLGVRF